MTRPSTERGAALITALLVVSLAAVLVSGLLWRQEVQIRRVENQRESLQARWISRGAFDWTRLILRSEADSAPVTYLGGVWSVPIAPTRLSDFLGQMGVSNTAEAATTWLSGSITDAQGMFNLRNLVTGGAGSDLQIDPAPLAQFTKLMSVLGLRSELAQSVATQMRLSLMQSATKVQKAQTGNAASDALAATQAGPARAGGGFTDDPGLRDSDDGSAGRPIQMVSLSSLLDVPGFTPAMIERLTPFLTILPTPTPLNLNTAPAEVVAAAIPALSLPAAQNFVHARDQAFLVTIGDAQNRMQRYLPPSAPFDSSSFAVTTQYFWIRGRVQQDRAVVDRSALIYRDPRTHSTTVVRVVDMHDAGR